MQAKYLRPKGYRPPTSATSLLDRYHRGERYFEGARLRGECLDNCQLDNVNLTRADLSSAFMRHASFARVDFTGSRCVNTNFEKSALYQCSFARGDLRKAWFYMSRVAFVSFYDTRVERAQFLACLQWARQQEKPGLLISPPEGATSFVSYSGADRFPAHVAESLKRANMPHWFRPYSSWFDSEVSEHLAREIRLCDYFVLVLSKNALGSRWVRFEANSALRLQGSKDSPRIVILRTGESNLPETGRLAVLSGHRLIECSGPNRATGIEELIALLRNSKRNTRTRSHA